LKEEEKRVSEKGWEGWWRREGSRRNGQGQGELIT